MNRLIKIIFIITFCQAAQSQSGITINGNIATVTQNGQAQTITCADNENVYCVNNQCGCHSKGTSININTGAIVVDAGKVKTNSSFQIDFESEIKSKISSCLIGPIKEHFDENNCDFGETLTTIINNKKFQCSETARYEARRLIRPNTSDRSVYNMAIDNMETSVNQLIEQAFDFEYRLNCGLDGVVFYRNNRITIIQPSVDPIIESNGIE